MDKKKWHIIAGAATVGLIVFFGWQNQSLHAKVERLSRELQDTKNELNNTMLDVYSRQKEQLRSLIEESQNELDEFVFSYNGIDTNRRTVRTLVEFSLKEADDDFEVSVAYVPQNVKTSPANVSAEKVDALRYRCQLELPYSSDYSFYFYGKTLDGTARKLNTKPIPLYVQSDFANRTQLSTSGGELGKDGLITTVELRNNTFGEDGFRIKKIEFILSADNQEIYREDVTQRNITNAKEVEHSRLDFASGNLDSESDIVSKIYGAPKMDENKTETCHYQIIVSPDQLPPELDLDQYARRFEVTYQNGETASVE